VSPAADRDHTRFQELYRATRTDLLAYLARRCASPEDAADLLAETYLIAWRKLDQLPNDQGARLWLFGVSRRLLLKHARRRHVAAELTERLAIEIRAARSTWPIDETEHAALNSALAQLAPLDREILTLNAWEGLTPREISEVIHMPANAVRIRLHRSRTRLIPTLTPPPSTQPRDAPVAANADR
jgi:RNA polymerase sigma factor (sigma-70 family)